MIASLSAVSERNSERRLGKVTSIPALEKSQMRPHTSAEDSRHPAIRLKLDQIRALAVLYLASMSFCGCSAAARAVHIQKAMPDPPAVVFIGDSITAIWGSTQGPQFAEHPNWVDKGISGQNSSQVLARFQSDVIDFHPQIVHILIGTNDVYPGWTLYPSGTGAINSAANVEAMVQMAQANGIHIILATIPPWSCIASNCTLAEGADSTLTRYDRINAWNAWIEQYALSKGIPVADYHSALLAADGEHYVPDMTLDGVHPSAAGYVVMTPMVESIIDAIASLYTGK
jgi:lysophospholipase L1-like esterase